MAITRLPRLQQITTPSHLLPLPRHTHRHKSPPPHITLHHLPRRTMAIQLGTQPRPTPNQLPVTRLRRLTMGHHTRPLQLEHRRPTTRRHPTLRHTNLRQPTRNLLAPSPPRRLERRRNAHTANRLDHLRPPQRSRIIPPHIHHTQQLAQPTHLHTIRRRRLILLPLDQRPIRRIQQKLTQRRTLRHHTLPQQKRPEHHSSRSLPLIRRIIPRSTRHVPTPRNIPLRPPLLHA